MNTYEINLNAITDELVETYNRLLHNDVCIADAYRDEATENFEGTVSLFVLTGRIEDNEEAFNYIEALKARFSNCRKSFEESYALEEMEICLVIIAVFALERLALNSLSVSINY